MVVVTALALLALFSIISILMSAEETGRPSDPRDNPVLWAPFGRR